MDDNQNNQDNQNPQSVPPAEGSTPDTQQPPTENIQSEPPAEAPTADVPQTPSENTQPQEEIQTQPQQTPEISSNPTVPEKKSSKLLLIGVLFLIIAIFVGGAYFYVQNQTEKPQETTPTQTQGSPSPTTYTAPDATMDWQTYSNSAFSVKYPDDLITGGDESMLNISKWGPSQTEGTELFDGFAVNFILKESPGTTPEDYAEILIAEAKVHGMSQVTQGPEPVTLNTYKGVGYTEESLGTYRQVILTPDDGSVLVLISILVADPGNLGFQEQVDQILSTFKFSS
jgi:hypothetical protein